MAAPEPRVRPRLGRLLPPIRATRLLAWTVRWAASGTRSRTCRPSSRPASSSLDRGEGVARLGRGRPALPRCHRVPLVLQRRLRPCRDRRRRREQLRRLPAYSTFGDNSNRPAIELAERVSATRAGRGQQGLPHERRLRLDRHRDEDRPPLLAAPRPDGSNAADHARGRLPRHARRGDEPRRHRGEPSRLRHARRRRREGGVGLRRRAPGRDRRRPAPSASPRSSASR